MLNQSARNRQSRNRSPHSTYIHNLDDDSLLTIFYLCRSHVLDEDEDVDTRSIPNGGWSRERWWYRCIQVCQRWRYLILRSASHLGLCLLCTHGTPVADMLAHSPPLPLIIDHWPIDQDHVLTAHDEEGIILALQHRDRVRHIRLGVPVQSLQRLITAIDEEFPVLESLYIRPPTQENINLKLPTTFEAPNLRHLVLYRFASLVGSPLLETANGLVTLTIRWIHPFASFPPNNLLQQLSHMPQLEILRFSFRSPAPNRDVERQLLSRRITTRVTLPNLRYFGFGGTSAYLEALLPQMTTPVLEKLRVSFFNQLTFSVPRLLQFMRSTESLTFSHATVVFFSDAVAIRLSPRIGTQRVSYIIVSCHHLDWQVSSVAQILNALSPAFSVVVDLTLVYEEHRLSPEWHNEADRTQWRKLLGSCSNVKTLRVHNDLAGQLSRSLPLDGEPPLEVLPELKELVCPTDIQNNKTFAPFVREREVAGKPVSLIGEAFPTSRARHVYQSSARDFRIRPDRGFWP